MYKAKFKHNIVEILEIQGYVLNNDIWTNKEGCFFHEDLFRTDEFYIKPATLYKWDYIILVDGMIHGSCMSSWIDIIESVNKEKYPAQPLYYDENKTLRFKGNAIVQHMVDKLFELGYDLNDLHRDTYNSSKEDMAQFSMLAGYSVSGAPHVDQDLKEVLTNSFINKTTLEEEEQKHTLEYLNKVRNMLKEGVAELFNIHPSNLE